MQWPRSPVPRTISRPRKTINYKLPDAHRPIRCRMGTHRLDGDIGPQ